MESAGRRTVGRRKKDEEEKKIETEGQSRSAGKSRIRAKSKPSAAKASKTPSSEILPMHKDEEQAEQAETVRPTSEAGVDLQPAIRSKSMRMADNAPLRRVSLHHSARLTTLLLGMPTAEVRKLAGADDASDLGPWSGDQVDTSDCGQVAGGRYICFQVVACPPRGGQVLVCGAWECLGAWDETRAVELLPEPGMQGTWVSLCVTAPAGDAVWPLDYLYLLRPQAKGDRWYETEGGIWEAPYGAAARRMSVPPPLGHVLICDDVFGESLLDSQIDPLVAPASRRRAPRVSRLRSFLDERLRVCPPLPGAEDRPYQFSTEDLLLTVLLYWPSTAEPSPPQAKIAANMTQDRKIRKNSAEVQSKTSDQHLLPLLLFLHGFLDRDPWRWVMPGVVPKALYQTPQRTGNPVLCSHFCVCSPLMPPQYYWTRKEPKKLGGDEWQFEDVYFPSMAKALQELVLWLQIMLPVDPDRTYLSGNSAGGYGAWELARLYPKLFAALAVTCGHYEPCSIQRIARLICSLQDAQLPIWVFHGRDDNLCSFEEAEETVQLLRRQEEEPSSLNSVVGKTRSEVQLSAEGIRGHGAWDSYSKPELFEWMLSKRRGRDPRHDSGPSLLQGDDKLAEAPTAKASFFKWFRCLRSSP